MNCLDELRAFAHGRRHPLGRPRSDITDREDSVAAGLEQSAVGFELRTVSVSSCALCGVHSGARASNTTTLKVFAPAGMVPPLRP